MIRSRRLLTVAAAAALALGVSACSGEEQAQTEETVVRSPVQPRPTEPDPALPRLPTSEIRVVDGDLGKPVARALVAVRAERRRTNGDGVAALGPLRKRVRVTIDARGYEARAVRVDFRRRLEHEVRLWRTDSQWPLFGANPARTQVHPGIKLRPPFRRVWSRSFYGLLEFPAVVWGGVGYVNNIKGWLRAFTMDRGRPVWKQRIGTRVASSPAIDPERRALVITTMNPGDVKIVSMDTGRVRWSYRTGRGESSPVIRDGVAYFGAENGNVYALDLDRRRPRWIFRGGVKVTSSPALVGNRLYFGDYAGRVFALDARTGRVLWRGSAGGRVYGTVAVAGGRVLAPSVFSGLSALSARTGRLLWRIPVGAYLYSSPAAFRGRVYFGTYAGVVYCASASSGRILWRRPTGGRVSGAVQVVAGVVYAATLENRTTAWHWRSGRTLWSFPEGEYVPVSGNGGRLLMHGRSRIWAVEPKGRR